MTQDVINGKADFMTEDPTGDELRRCGQVHRPLLGGPQPAEHVLLLPRPQDPAVRQAGGAPGGQLRARQPRARADLRWPAHAGLHVPPPDLVGYKDYECAYGDPDGKPDIEKAKQLVKESGYEG